MPGINSSDLSGKDTQETLVRSQDFLSPTVVLNNIVKNIGSLLPLQAIFGDFNSIEFGSKAIEIQSVEKPHQSSLKPFLSADICGEVLHIAQRHYSSLSGDEQIEPVWKSQVKIAKELQKHPNATVFVEGLEKTSHNCKGLKGKVMNSS